MQSFTVLYIYSTGHSGSTLLNMLLNAHPQITGLSEVCTFRGFFSPKDHPLVKNQFWQKVKKEYTILSKETIQDIDFEFKDKDRKKSYRQNQLFYQAIANIAKTPYIVDASKNLERLKILNHLAFLLKLSILLETVGES